MALNWTIPGAPFGLSDTFKQLRIYQVDSANVDTSGNPTGNVLGGSDRDMLAVNTYTGINKDTYLVIVVSTTEYVLPGTKRHVTYTLEPSGARTAGAQWKVDSATYHSAWQSSGSTLDDVPADETCTVSFSSVYAWYSTPANVNIASGSSPVNATATYTALLPGTVTTTISPSAVVTDGAKWQLNKDTDPTYYSGDLASAATHSPPGAGAYYVRFVPVSGWTKPFDITGISVAAGSALTYSGATCTYSGVVASPISIVTTESGGQATLQVSLSLAPVADVTVTPTIIAGTGQHADALAATWEILGRGDPTITFTSANWSTPRTIKVSPVNDGQSNPDGYRTFALQLASVSGDTRYNNLTRAIPGATYDTTDPVIVQGDSVAVTMDEDSSPTAWTAPTVTAVDVETDTLTWSKVSGPTHGTAVVSGTGISPTTFTYVPPANWNGSDSFVIQVSDGGRGTDTITVNVTVNPRNDPPQNVASPQVTGSPELDSVLTAQAGTWNDPLDLQPGTVTFSYLWYRADSATGTNAAAISGATADQYTVVGADVGKYLCIAVTATDDGEGLPSQQSTTATSVYVGPVPEPVTVIATHSVNGDGYRSPGVASITCTFEYPVDRTLLSLLWHPTLPAGWTLASVTGDGTPEIQQGDIVLTGSLLANPVHITYLANVPAGQSGSKQVSAVAQFLVNGMTNAWTVPAAPDPVSLALQVYHTADYRDSRWVIDGTEVNRVLAYWRAGAYHVDAAGLDGFVAGAGSTSGGYHAADYRDTRWVIDGTEVNRVLAYWRAGAYHADAVGLDGYAAGAARTQGTRDTVTAAQSMVEAKYTAGQTITISNTLTYTGTLWSLLWRPHLPTGWTVVPDSLSGDGSMELVAGEMVWTGSLPASPVDFAYQVTVPSDATGDEAIQGEVEYQLSSMANPATTNATPDPMTVSDRPSLTNWAFTVSGSPAAPATVTLGMYPDATDGVDDGIDITVPPSVPGADGVIYLMSDPLDLDGVTFRTDLRAPDASAIWYLVAETGANPMTLSWDAASLPTDTCIAIDEVEEQAGVLTPVDGSLVFATEAGLLDMPAAELRFYRIRYLPVVTAQIDLAEGWNMTSLPVEPLDGAATHLFGLRGQDGDGGALRDGRRGSIYSSSIWEWNHAAHVYEHAEVLHALGGYWVMASVSTTVPVRGIAVEPKVELLRGWNMTGVGVDAPLPDLGALAGPVWTYAGGPDYQAATALEACKSYWFYALRTVTLDLSGK
ncbi:MAG: hypothetical protein A3K19_32845 [Lentisphaerae bacterium RIFOXYB12_FULL_65_16]|nr:MAG: hypothetical protein A3K19_32845 [Lentisphaerae bacterium RIFOXYB12_FULL_65_16]